MKNGTILFVVSKKLPHNDLVIFGLFLSLANDTRYGLASYFFTRDLGRTFRVMEELQYGMVAINESTLSIAEIPFGGVKESGLGREGGRHALLEYVDEKYAMIGGLGC